MSDISRQHDSLFPARRIVLAGLLVFGTLFSFAAQAAIALDDWRNQIVELRAKAENDAPRAYREAQLLQKEIPAGVTPADRARVLNLLSRIELHLALIPESVRHSAEAKVIAKQGSDAAGQVEADLNIALGAINQGRLDDMIAATQDGMGLLETIQRDDLRAEMMFQAAMMYLRFGQIDEAVTVAMQAQEVARNSGNPRVRAYAEQSMGVAYVQSGRYADAREHYRSMLEAARQAHYTLLEAAAILGLSAVADGMGDSGEAVRLTGEASKLFRRVGAPFYVSHAQHQLADMYLRSKQPGKALPLLDNNAKIYEQHENPIGLWWTLQARSRVLQAMGRLEQARQDVERAYALARQIGFNVYMSDSARRLSELIAARGDYKEAYRWSSEAATLKEKADREKSGTRILALAERFQKESKQRQIDELNHHNERQHARQQQILIGLAAIASLLAVTIFFLLRLRKSRAEIRSLNVGLEQRVLERTLELFESRQSLAEAQRIAQLGSWELDHASNVLTWSDESYRIFEIDHRHFGNSYEAFLAAVHPDDRDRVHDVFQTSLMNRHPYEIEHRLSFPGGRIKYVHEHCETTYGDDGKPLRSIGTVQDITERKEMENALRESRQLLAEAQRIAQVGSWEYDIANDSHIWSDELFRIYEIDPVEEGASYEGCMDATHPDDREAIARLYLDAVETGLPYESEHRLLMADGRIKYVHERCEMVCAPNGTLLRAVGMMQDITERKLVEQKLKEALEFSDGVINAIPDILFELSRDGRYLNVWTQNPELLAAQKEQLLGKTAAEVLSSEAAAAAMAAIREADEKGYAHGLDIAIDLPGGRRWFSHTLSKKTGGAPDEATFLVLSRDITERKQLEEELAARERNFRSLTENLPDNVARWDTRGRYLYINPTHAQTVGIAANDIVGKALPDTHDQVKAAIAQVVATGKAITLVRQPLLVDGKPRIHEVSLAPEYDAEGRIVSVVGLGRDMTDICRMQDVIAARERELRALAESSPGMMGSYYRKPDGRLCMPYVSLNVYDLFGVRPEEVAEDATPLMQLTHPDDVQRVNDTIAESARTMTPWHCEYRILHPVKGERWMEGNSNPQPHPDGGTIWYGYVHDITERKRSEQKLKEAVEFNEGVINAIPDLLFEVDSGGRYLNIWTHTPELLTAQKEALLGNTVGNMLAPEAAATVIEALREAGEIGVSFGKTITIDLPAGKSWFELSVSKKVGGTFLVLSRDITARKRMEAELRASRNFLDSVIDSVSDPIFVKDRQHRWTLLNDAFCAFIGHPREVLAGKSDYDFFPKEQADVFWAKDELVFESGESNLNEERFTTASGEEHYIQTRKTPFISGDGRQMLVGVIRDITDLKRYETAREAALDEAQRLAKLRSEFIAHMSHELRTPLNGILGYAQMLGRDGRLDQKQHASVEVIRQSGEHLLALIEDILDLARIESGRLALDIVDIQLARFLDVVAGIVGVRAKQKHIEFVCEFAPELPGSIRGDEKRLRQVLLNLLSNAIKFTDQGKVTLRVSRVTPSRLAFAVADTGIGIAPSDRETIFQSFEQVSDAQHRQGGSGLGLSISRQLVRLMGGDIAVESRPGYGSTFRFELELPEVDPVPLRAVSVETPRVEPVGEEALPAPLLAPPAEKMRELHRLALLGNMRDIVDYAERMASQDVCYRPFAEHLKRLAEGFQSRAILALAEKHLPSER